MGEVYFVIDGNHRVSIVREEGRLSIDAHVIEMQTNIPFTADMRQDEVDAQIIQAEQADFLAETRILALRPNVDLAVTTCYQYEKILEQIRLRLHLLQQGALTRSPLKRRSWIGTTMTISR